MKTLFIIYYRLDLGGIQTKIINIANYLKENYPSVKLFIFLREKHHNDRIAEILNNNATVFYYPNTRWSKLPFFFPIYIMVQTVRYKPVSILTFSFLPAITAIWAKLLLFKQKITVVISEDWSETDELARDLNGNLPLIRKVIFKIFYKKADYICAVSKPIKDTLIKKYLIPESKIYLIHNWYSPNLQKFIKNTAKIYDFIYTGRIEKIKNIRLILEGLIAVKKKRTDVKLCIVGSGSESGNLKKMVVEYKLTKNVIFTGYSPNPGKYINKSKIFVLASLSEGLPLSMLDAMYLRLPVLCSNYSGAHYIVSNNVNGYMFSDKKQFVEYSQKLLNNSKTRNILGSSGHELVIKQYNPENIKTEYLRLLKII